MSRYVYAKQIVLPNKTIQDAYLTLNDDGTFGRIVKSVPDNSDIIDYSDYTLSPGLVDTHIHGYGSHDVMDNSVEGLKEISEGLLSCGVTSWLPTTLTDSVENLNNVTETIGNHYQEVAGAKIRGVFLEGPYFTEEHKGAQNPKYMMDPSKEQLKIWYDNSNQLVNKIAIAPERQGVLDFINYANTLEVSTALAHSSATYDEAKAAVDAGANIFIHTFNGMSGLHHREPGMVGAALSLDDVYAEAISDGHHVHPAAIDIIVKSRGVEETVLVTDCMRAGGLPEGPSSLGEFDVIVKDGAARLADTENLAGSILELIQGVKNMVKWNLVSLPDALRMASLNPAKSVGIEGVCGQIVPGAEADFILVDDNGNLKATYLDGQIRYQAD